MIKAFLDASVLFSAAYSATGASRELLRMAISGSIELVVSRFVLEEAERNLGEKASDKVEALQALIGLLEPQVISDPSREELQRAAAYTALKDAPVVAGAISAAVDYLVSLDRKHLVNPAEIAQQSGLAIVLPQVVVYKLRACFKSQNQVPAADLRARRRSIK